MAASITSKSAILAYEQTTSTWGNIVVPTIGDMILAENFGPLVDPREVVPDPAAGYAWYEVIKNARKNVRPEINMIARYSGRMWSFLAQLMGLDSKSGSGDPYIHEISLLDAIDGSDMFGSLAGQLGPAAGELLFEYPAVKPIGITFEGPDGQGYMRLIIRTICNAMRMGADCTVTTANIDAVTHMQISSALPAQVPFGALRLRLNWVAGALSASDNLAVKKVSFVFDRGFDAEWASRNAQANEWESAEPIENGIPKQSLEIELGDLNALTYLEAFQDETEAKAELFWSLDANHDIKIEIPRMRLDVPDANISGQGRIPQTLKFMPMKASAAPTGMTCTNWQITIRDPNAVAYE